MVREEIISREDFEEMTGHKLLVGTDECEKRQEDDPCAENCPSFLGCYKFKLYSSLLGNIVCTLGTQQQEAVTANINLATRILGAQSMEEIKKITGEKK